MDLSPTDEFHISAAEGWLDLDAPLEAGLELDQIRLENIAHPRVLLLRCRLYLATHRAEYTHTIATTLIDRLPDLPDAWFYLACACSRLGTQDAASLALKKCFLAAAKSGTENAWQERALKAIDLDGLRTADQLT
jgi:predicted Zn-dependent protease